MLKGLTLSQLGAKLQDEQQAKEDYVVQSDKITMQVRSYQDNSEARRPVLELFDVGREFAIRPLAHDQIGSRLQIPAKYYDRMLDQQPDLLAMNVNTWLKRSGESGERRMIRTMRGSARAFLSDRYKRVENTQILKAALPALAKIPGADVVSSEISETRMYIQVRSRRIEGEVKKGDVIQAGVIISNSEVGAGSVSVQSMDYRLACLNGMVSGIMLRAYHVGRRVAEDGEMEQFWKDDTRAADDEALMLRVRDMVAAAVDEERFKQRIDQMRGLTKIEVKTNPQAAVEKLAASVGATDEESAGMLKALIKGGDLSAWGLLNAVTAQAHEAKSYDRAVHFEEAGGRLLSLSKRDWTEVLEAA